MVVNELPLNRHMLDALLNYLFGCSHKRTTFPLTHTAKYGNRRRTTYIACLNCGAEFVYDWKHMRVGLQLPTYASGRPLAWSALRSKRWCDSYIDQLAANDELSWLG